MNLADVELLLLPVAHAFSKHLLVMLPNSSWNEYQFHHILEFHAIKKVEYLKC